jgi:hypothetical protein
MQVWGEEVSFGRVLQSGPAWKAIMLRRNPGLAKNREAEHHARRLRFRD